MIILHRISVFAQTALTAGLFFFLLRESEYSLTVSIITLITFSLLQARLLGFEVKSWSFWIFFATPVAFLMGSIFFFFFLEALFIKWLIALVVTAILWMYLENLFTFYYLPGAYQPYSLEYLSLSMYLLFVFFFASGMYAAQIFLSLPIIIPFLALFWIILCASVCMFWVSKVNAQISLPYAVIGAIGLSQLYVALGFLPVSFIVNAAALTLCYYMYLGLVRAHVLEELSALVVRRYVGFVGLSLVLIFATTSWI